MLTKTLPGLMEYGQEEFVEFPGQEGDYKADGGTQKAMSRRT